MSNRNNLAALTAALALAFAGAAAAQSAAPAKAGAPATANKPRVATPDETFALWDKDKNKSLSLEEFKAGYQMVQAQGTVRKLHANFAAMDKNKSGALEFDEYANLELVKKAGAKAPAMTTFDTDKNGKLDFKEYLGMIEVMVKKQ
jgi:Ca2+-binding EF-hand superfamily protein